MPDRTHFEILAGTPGALGASLSADGCNFAIYSEHATAIDLCLFDATGVHELQRLPLPDRQGNVWHGFVPKAHDGLLYGYRVHGPYDPSRGHRFNPNKLLIDPYAKALSGPLTLHETQFGHQPKHPDGDYSFDNRDSAPFMPKCRLVAAGPAAETGRQPRTPWRDTLIYEVHVKGFTKLRADVAPDLRGTYAGLASAASIRHIKSLGITAVELLPITAFNDEPHLVAKGLTNYWGYNPFALMAPEPRYATRDARAELAQAVRRLHDANIEVILDVVFNHTGEGWHLGPTLSLKGIDNAAYYRLEPHNPARYVDHGGCGNTLDLSRPHVRQLMLDALRTWVTDYGIDGFRFDLATTLGREADGRFSPEAETLAAMRSDPILSRIKLIAEPWDCGPDGYQVGRFPEPWAEWNDKSRDTMRRFWRGDERTMPDFARRICGSAEDFGPHRAPLAAINYVTAHDGMRLADLVSFARKRNGANAEDNRDGQGEDWSSPYGPEGPSDDPAVNALRARQMRNLLATLLLSQGVPMLVAGDEVGHTQGGNNNPYCQDNAITWIDWTRGGEAGQSLCDFTRDLIALRRRYPALRQEHPLSQDKATWHSPDGRPLTAADWELPWARCFGLMLAPPEDGPAVHLLLLFNAHDGDIDFRLPTPPDGGEWSRLLDTAAGDGASGISPTYPLASRSLVVLAAPALRHKTSEPGTALDHLAALAGIAPAYHDIAGTAHVTTEATQRALLSAMGFAVGDPATEAQSLREAQDAAWAAPLPPVVIARLGASGEPSEVLVPVTVTAADLRQTLRWDLHLENGANLSGETQARDLDILDVRDVAGIARRRLALRLLIAEPGYHRLALALDGARADCTVIVAPAASYQPDWLREGGRAWGVAHQLYSLRRAGDGGIGDFTALRDLIAEVGRRGGAAVGINPLHALSLATPEDASPYFPSSRRFLNPLYIDVAAVPEARADDVVPSQPDSGRVDYSHVQAQKLAALTRLFERFRQGATDTTRANAFAKFLAAGGSALQSFALHRTLEECLGQAPTTDWARFGTPTTPDSLAFATTHAERVVFHAWLQFEADRQLQAAIDANRLAVGLYGDLAVGVDPMGADVWAEPGVFARSARIGAPPDQFSPLGQEWGLLPFDPQALRREAYRPFIDFIRAGMRYCGAIRIDHVMWLERVFWVPAGGKPADGAYVRFPVDDLMAVLALESHRNRCLVIGEDLGTVPAGFRERMLREGLLSYKLMRFERYPDGLYCRPSTYTRAALATSASHDLPTIIGHWTERDIEVRQALGLVDAETSATLQEERALERQLIVAALADQGLLHAGFPCDRDLPASAVHELIAAVHGFLARSPSALLMLNIEDLAASREQVNLPGPLVGYPCWRQRLDRTTGQILDSVCARRSLSEITHQRSAAPA